jgi:hypothetical protein
MENLNLAFYTYFIGSDNNPAFKIPIIPSLKYKCYYYTNNKTIFEKLKETNWIGVFINIETTDDMYESNMLGKHLKTMPHEYKEIKDYDYLCYLDSKLVELSETFIENYIQKYFINDKYALLLRQHPEIGDSVWNEYNFSMIQLRYIYQRERYRKYIKNQLSKGLHEKTKYHCTCSFLLRNMKHKKIIELNSTWYNHIQECGIQDQISFFFVKQLFADCILPFAEKPFKDINACI